MVRKRLKEYHFEYRLHTSIYAYTKKEVEKAARSIMRRSPRVVVGFGRVKR